MKNTLTILCWGFMMTVSEPTRIKMPSRATHQEREQDEASPVCVWARVCVLLSACDNWSSGTDPCCPGDCF